MTTRAREIPFGEWLPDLPDHMNPGALIARNVIPEIKSYRGLNSLQSFTDALADVCLGSFWLQAADGTVHNFAGDATKLYRLAAASTWDDVSGLSAPYSAANWDFTKFGSRVIAADRGVVLQYFDAGASSVFADLPNAPQAARIATVRDFVVVGDIAGLGPNHVQWSGFNNSEIWTPSIATQSDRQELFGRGGRVMRVVPGEYGLVFQEHSIWRMDYTGPPTIFQFDEVERKRGTPAPGSVTWAGGNVFYYGWDGFYHFDGVKSDSISHNKASRWFERNAAADALISMRAAVDRLNRTIIWAFRTSASAPINNRLLFFNWAANRWAYAELDTQVIEEYVSSGFTLDELDTILADIDSESINVDSTAFQGGALNLQAFNADNEAAAFDGSPLEATIDTKEISAQTGRGLYCNKIEPLVEGASPAINVQIGSRDRLSQNPSFGPPRALNGYGEANLRQNANYLRFRLRINGGFDHAQGVLAHVAARHARRKIV